MTRVDVRACVEVSSSATVSPMANADIDEVRRDVALASRVLDRNGLDDKIWGHVSIRDPHNRGLWMKRSKLGFDEITPDTVHLIGWDGTVLDGGGPRHEEWPIHAGIMAARPDVGSVVHAHPPNATALGASGQPLRPISHEACLFGGDVPRFTHTTTLITTPSLGEKVAETMDGQRDGGWALLLVNHGIVTAGRDHRDAVFRGITLEEAARKQRFTVQMGGLAAWSSPEDVAVKQEQIYHTDAINAAWDYLVRELDTAPR